MDNSYSAFHTRLSLLQHLSSFYPSDLLKNAYLIGCQHILPSTHLMLRSLFDIGLRPERTALIGKCYSTSPKVQDAMLNEEIIVCPSSNQFDSNLSFDDQFKKNLARFFKNILIKFTPPKEAHIIILDDGGELISLVNEVLSNHENIFAVEQTSSGYHKLIPTHSDLKIPVINVARSRLKLMVESPFIVETQIERITQHIQKLGLSPQKCLIVGNGILGQCLAQRLDQQYQVTCYDKIPRRSSIKRDDLDLSEFDLVIGTTGETIIKQADFNKLKGNTVLVSISSSDREFDAVNVRKAHNKVSNCHENLMAHGIYLLNCGFPINFQGNNEDSIPLNKIQLTMGLLFGGICQGVELRRSSPPRYGLIHLDSALQRNIQKSFFKFLGKEPVVDCRSINISKKRSILPQKAKFTNNYYPLLLRNLNPTSKSLQVN